MPEIAKQPAQSNVWFDRADELFQQHRQEIYRKTDQLFARLMLCQWVAAILMAMIISPRTWAGQSSQIHIHIWAAIFMGGAITFFPIWMTRAWPGSAPTRYIIAVAQMLMSVLLIDLTGGRIETHFHVFGSLVILSFYRDWRVLIPATIVVYLDHFLRGIYWPYSVYGVLSASPWRSPRRFFGTASWSSWTNPPRRSAWPRRRWCSLWSDVWPTGAMRRSSCPTT